MLRSEKDNREGEDSSIMGDIRGAGVCLITKDLRVLLLYQNKSEKWGIPKGHREVGETFEQTWIRELFEETGIRITSNFFDIGGPSKCYKYMVKFYMIDDIIIPNGGDRQEIGGYCWIRLQDIKDIPINGATRYALDHLIEKILLL